MLFFDITEYSEPATDNHHHHQWTPLSKNAGIYSLISFREYVLTETNHTDTNIWRQSQQWPYTSSVKITTTADNTATSCWTPSPWPGYTTSPTTNTTTRKGHLKRNSTNSATNTSATTLNSNKSSRMFPTARKTEQSAPANHWTTTNS